MESTLTQFKLGRKRFFLPSALALIVFILFSPAVSAQNALRTFRWDQGDRGHGFWNKAINCGGNNQPGGANNTKGSKVTFGVTSEIRFPGTRSVEYWTNSNYEETCNQNFTAERAEMSAYGSFRGLGAREGSTVWFGWSEKWTEMDMSHTTTTMQFRNNCGAGSPACAFRMQPGGRLQVRSLPGNQNRNNFVTIQEDVWYDFVIEFKYSKNRDGYIKVWVKTANDTRPFDYNNPTTQILNSPTMFQSDGCPHIRWGSYRWESGDKKPGQIRPEDRIQIKYVSTVRMHIGSNLGAQGLRTVEPRDPSGNPAPPPAEPEVPTAEPEPDVPCTLTADWTNTDIGNPTLEGEACEVDGTYTVSSASRDIWGNSDQFHFLYQKIAGDVEITARMTQITQANPLSKAGVMIRNSLEPGSRHIFMALNASNTRSFQYRDQKDGLTVNKSQNIGGFTTPHWIKLIRTGNTLTGLSSTDGVNWEIMDQLDMIMGEEVYVGLASTSHDGSKTNDAKFDNVSIDGNSSFVPTNTTGTGLCFEESVGRLVVEAESFTANVPGIEEAIETQWEMEQDPDASNGEAIYANGPGFNSQDRLLGGRIDYKISFPKAGTYYLWARMKGSGLADDSFHAGVNGNAETFGGYGLTTTNHNAWIWVGSVLGNRISLTIPTPGEYLLNAWIREDGTMVDKFIISDDENYLPIGSGPVESAPCTTPSEPESCTGTDNLALNKPVRQSSIYGNGNAGIAVDGDTDGSRGPWRNPSITHTRQDAQAWWEVDLGAVHEIDEITYFGRTECCQDRLRDVYVIVSPTPFTSNDLQVNLGKSDAKYTFISDVPNPSNTIAMEKFKGRYVRFQLRETNHLSLAEVQVLGCTTPVANGNTESLKFGDPTSEIADPALDLLTLAPNPTSGDTRVIMYNEHTGTLEITVHDMMGRKVQREVIQKDAPDFSYMLLLNNLTNGFYTVTVSKGNYRKSERILINR